MLNIIALFFFYIGNSHFTNSNSAVVERMDGTPSAKEIETIYITVPKSSNDNSFIGFAD